MPYAHRLTPGRAVHLDKLPTRAGDDAPDRDAAESELEDLRARLAELQWRFYAEGRRKLLVVLQGLDTAGKDGTIRHVFRGVNPQGVRVASFKAPTDEELSRDFLWRIHKQVPAAGMIAVFNRSHYEDVLVVRVRNLAPPDVWKARYDPINAFEQLLAATGTTILKFYLHISRGEQKERLQARLDDPKKNWKLDPDDLANHKLFEPYMRAYEDALERCNTPSAPWHAIPSDQKWYRNLAVARSIVQTLEELDPRFPLATPLAKRLLEDQVDQRE
jgi:PPK2 family polyphosphate:nucleotide phosphotransferase